MNDERSFERTAQAWLELGTSQAPERAIQAVLLAIETTPQDRDLRVPWRLWIMTISLRVGAAAVIGLLLLGAAFYVFSGGGSDVGGWPTSTSSSTPGSPDAEASPALSAARTPDFSALTSTILLEHVGNALDGTESEPPNPPNPTRRLYVMDSRGLREFTPYPPIKAFPDWSPDGRRIAYSDADYGTATKIFEAGLDGEAHMLSTICATCNEDYPDYSPDGARIAYLSWQPRISNPLIAIRDLASGEVTELPTTASDVSEGFPEKPRWSPDGTRIVYALVQRSNLGRPGRKQPAVASHLFIVDVTTGAVTPLDVGMDHVGDASWSPDGTRILFANRPFYISGSLSTHDIYSVSVDGTDLWQLTREGASGAPSWTPDGRILFFRASSAGEKETDGDRSAVVGSDGLWLMDADGSNAASLGTSLPDLSSDANGFAYYGYWQPSP